MNAAIAPRVCLRGVPFPGRGRLLAICLSAVCCSAIGCCYGDDRDQFFAVSVAASDGTGGFLAPRPAIRLPAEDLPPRLGDVNGDGLADLVVSSGGDLVVFLGPSLAVEWARVPAGFISSLIVEDVDRDGDKDIIVQSFTGLTTFIAGAGTLTPVDSPGLLPLDLGQISSGPALDLLALVPSPPGQVAGPTLEIFVGDGLGGFSATGVTLPERSGTLGDMDGDGLDDFVAIDNVFHIIRIYRNDGAGGFLAPDEFPVPRQQIRTFTTTHLDDDASLDVVLGLDARSRPNFVAGVAVLFGDGLGGVGPALEIPNLESSDQLAVADTDGDGDRDIVVRGDETLHILENDGARGFSKIVVGSQQGDLAVDDVDGDGSPDIVLNTFFEETQESCWPSI